MDKKENINIEKRYKFIGFVLLISAFIINLSILYFGLPFIMLLGYFMSGYSILNYTNILFISLLVYLVYIIPLPFIYLYNKKVFWVTILVTIIIQIIIVMHLIKGSLNYSEICSVYVYNLN